MKVQYKFASETIEIEVSDEWGEILIDLDRQEYNNDHKPIGILNTTGGAEVGVTTAGAAAITGDELIDLVYASVLAATITGWYTAVYEPTFAAPVE